MASICNAMVSFTKKANDVAFSPDLQLKKWKNDITRPQTTDVNMTSLWCNDGVMGRS